MSKLVDDYGKRKQAIIKALQEITDDGCEGVIPMLIKECLNEVNYKHNTKEHILSWTSKHCMKAIKK